MQRLLILAAAETPAPATCTNLPAGLLADNLDNRLVATTKAEYVIGASPQRDTVEVAVSLEQPPDVNGGEKAKNA